MLNPSFEVLGDRRWPAELLAQHMAQAERKNPHQPMNYKTGDSGADSTSCASVTAMATRYLDEISTGLQLNRSGDTRPKVTIPVPFYLGGMSLAR
jgi:hypothetical protein